MDEKQKNCILQIRIEPELLDKFNDRCKEEHRNKSETLRMLIINYIDKK